MLAFLRIYPVNAGPDQSPVCSFRKMEKMMCVKSHQILARNFREHPRNSFAAGIWMSALGDARRRDGLEQNVSGRPCDEQDFFSDETYQKSAAVATITG